MADATAAPAELSFRFEEALVWAHQLHREQRRGKGGDIAPPYVVHLLSVCALVLEDGGDEEEAIAALLHDAVEDQGGVPVLKEIRRRFGDRVADIVWSCSDAAERPKPPWLERKKQHIAHLRGASRAVRRVTAADKLHNARSIVADLRRRDPAGVWAVFKGGREGTLWYYGQMLDLLREDGSSVLIQELERVVADMEMLSGPPTTPAS